MSAANTLEKSTMTGPSDTLTPDQKYELWKQLGTDPALQAMALRDKIARNLQLENEWNAKIAAIEAQLRGLDSVIKVTAHDQAGNLIDLGDIDLRGAVRKLLFDKKLRLANDRDTAMQGA